MKIQLISTYYYPETTGNAPYASGLAEGLAALGHDVSVVAAAPHYPGWAIRPSAEWEAHETSRGVTVDRVTSYVPKHPTFLKRLAYEVMFGLKFAARLDEGADAVIMVSPSLFGSAVARLRLGRGAKRPRTILWMQDLYSAGVRESHGLPARLFAAALGSIEGTICRSFEDIVVIHSRFRDYVTKVLGVGPDHVNVIRNWTHVGSVELEDALARRRELGWDDPSEIIVVHAGNMGAKQDLDNVIDAGRIAQERDLPIRFVLIGDGNQREHLGERAQGNSRVEFVDPLPAESFLSTLAAADVLLVNERPGLQEAAVPSKLTTYFATGRPVLAATEATSATADEIRASAAGRIVPSGDPKALVTGALTLPSHWSDEDAAAGPRYVEAVLSETAAIAAFDHLLTTETALEAQKAGV